MCDKCNDTGARSMTEDELEMALDADDEFCGETLTCECAIGQARHKAFMDKWTPLIEADIERINRKYAKEG